MTFAGAPGCACVEKKLRKKKRPLPPSLFRANDADSPPAKDSLRREVEVQRDFRKPCPGQSSQNSGVAALRWLGPSGWRFGSLNEQGLSPGGEFPGAAAVPAGPGTPQFRVFGVVLPSSAGAFSAEMSHVCLLCWCSCKDEAPVLMDTTASFRQVSLRGSPLHFVQDRRVHGVSQNLPHR